MIKFNTILLYKNNTELFKSTALDLMRMGYSGEVIDNMRGADCSMLYRGSYSEEVVIKRTIPTTDRKSKNTYNYYTVFFDYLMDNELGGWKSTHPRRSRSIICTTDIGYALGMGSDTVFDVFVPNGQTLISCSSEDIWISCPLVRSFLISEALINGTESIQGYCKDLQAFSEYINHIIELITGVDDMIVDNSSVNDILNILDLEFNNLNSIYFVPFRNKFNTFVDFLAYLLNFSGNGFELIKYKIGMLLPLKRLIWFNSLAILVERDHVDYIVLELNT